MSEVRSLFCHGLALRCCCVLGGLVASAQPRPY
jgi:hypothetical protein